MRTRRAPWRSIIGIGVGVPLLLGPVPAGAYDLVTCRMPNGEVRVVAVPPDGCEVDSPSKLRRKARSSDRVVVEAAAAPVAPPSRPWPPRVPPAAEPTPEQPTLSGAELAAFLEWAMKDRLAIEGRAEALAQTLESHRERVAALEPIEPENFQSSAHGSASYVGAMRERAETLEKLRAEELDLRRDLDAVRDEFSVLSSRVAAANGGEFPETWNPQMQCESCPRS